MTTKTGQKVYVKIPGVRQMPIVRTTIHKIRSRNRVFIGQYQNMLGETVKVWRMVSGDTWRPLS